jgi:hypothetical protein
MKRLGRVIGIVLAGMLAVLSLQVLAETPLAGRDFNHDATGFPLTGVHTLTACETCHAGGVFKGTPRNCDACHALGKRIVATPKSTGHIVTDAPCDTCHFNASTFLGARFNHATAVPGTCATCHNGRQSVGKPASHSSGNKATKSCDSCHRSYTWFNASWNHVGIPMGGGTCAQSDCHLSGSGNLYTAATATSPINHMAYNDTRAYSCDRCHISFVTWTSTMHEPQTGTCSSCHNGASAQGPRTDHLSWVGWPMECTQCHSSTTTWLGALGAMPSNHIPASTWAGGATCISCHPTPTTWKTGASLHVYVSSICKTCHDSGSAPAYLGVTGRKTLGSHEGSKTTQDCISCHAVRYTSWNKP